MVDEQGLKSIEEAIGRAESKTAGELRVCLARRSSPMGLLPAAAAGIVAVFPAYFLTQWLYWGHAGFAEISLAIVGALTVVGGLVLLFWPASKNAVRNRAILEFHRLGISNTQGRTGVLIYLSMAEKRAELLADKAIDEKVEEGTWQTILDRMIEGIRGKKDAGPVVEAVDAVGDHLAKHFPRGDDDANELPDKVEVR